MGVEKFSGSRGGWPMSDNDIFQGGQTPDDTMIFCHKIFYISRNPANRVEVSTARV